MIKVNEVQVGAVVEMNNLVMYRIFNTFSPEISIDAEHNIVNGSIRVWYWEYLKKADGSIYAPSKVHKHYIVADVPELRNEAGEVIRAAFPAFTGWLNNIARTPVNVGTPGLLDAIEYTLAGLPVNVENGYTLQTPA